MCRTMSSHATISSNLLLIRHLNLIRSGCSSNRLRWSSMSSVMIARSLVLSAFSPIRNERPMSSFGGRISSIGRAWSSSPGMNSRGSSLGFGSPGFRRFRSRMKDSGLSSGSSRSIVSTTGGSSRSGPSSMGVFSDRILAASSCSS